MHQLVVALAVAAAGLLIAVGLVQGRAAARRREAARKGWFDGCLPLFDAPRLGPTDHGFARLNGHYRGHLFDLQALPDTLTFRKLPSLWLLISIPEPLPVRGILDIMVRPTGGEIFSRFASLPVAIETPPGFPPDTAIRTDGATFDLTPELTERLKAAFHLPRVKELVLSPKGLRIVWLAGEADRNRFLLYRDAEVGQTPLEPATLRLLLDLAAGLAALLAAKERT